jgi:hypothetical protein
MYSIVDLVGTAGQSNFTFGFPYLSQDHIHMYIDGIETTDFTFLSEFIVTLDTPLVADATVRVRRLTPIAEPAVDFTNGSVLGESDLDASALQLLYVVQETVDIADSTIQANNDFNYDAKGHRIVNLADPIDLQDAVTKRYADEQSGTQAQNDAVERAEAAAAEATLDLTEIQAIDLTNVSEYMRTVLAAEDAAAARGLLAALTGVSPVLENPTIVGTLGGSGYFIQDATLTGTFDGTYELVAPTVTDPVVTAPEINGNITGTPNFSVTPTFTTPLPGTLTAGTQLVQNPYAVSAQPSQAHGLGAAPKFITWYLECLVTDLGYAAGDRIEQMPDIDNGTTVRGFTVSYDATTCRISTPATAPIAGNKASNVTGTITVAKWKLVVTPYRLN